MAQQGKTFDEIMQRFHTIRFEEKFDMVVAIAYGGLIPAAIINQRLNAELHLIKVKLIGEHHRQMYGQPELITPVNFDFKGKTILLVDDRIKTGSTVECAKELMNGAKLIKTFAVNGRADYSLYNEMSFRLPWML